MDREPYPAVNRQEITYRATFNHCYMLLNGKRFLLNTRPYWRMTILLILLCLSAAPLRAQWEQMKVGSFVNVHALTFADSTVFAGAEQGLYRLSAYGGWGKVDSMSAFCVAGNDSAVFAGTKYGVIHSSDGGGAWTSPDSLLGRINALALADTSIYAGGAGLYRSQDNGKTWIDIGKNLLQSQFPIHGLAVTPGRLWVATNAGLTMSSDDGAHWSTIGQSGGLVDYCVTVVGSTLFAGTSGGLFRTDVKGYTWSRAGRFSSITSVYSVVANQSYLFAGTEMGVYRSGHNGQT